MKIHSFLRVLGALLSAACLFLGAALATVVPAAAGTLGAVRLDAPLSLQLDAAAHSGMLVDADTGQLQARAFFNSALEHDLFNGDRFGLGRVAARL